MRGGEKVFLNGSFAKRPHVAHMLICSTMFGGDWRLAVGGGWRLPVGDWRLVAVGGGWRRLVVGDWWLVVVGSGCWSPLAVGGGWRLAVGGWWRSAVGGGWWLAVGGPLGRSQTSDETVQTCYIGVSRGASSAY